MMQCSAAVDGVEQLPGGLVLLRLHAPVLAGQTKPGQFVNLRVSDSLFPLLRRPFSVYRVDGDCIELLFSVIGAGTALLAAKRAGERVDLLGPLGNSFSVDGFTGPALLVGGGLGVAALPMLCAALTARGVHCRTFLGARSGDLIVDRHLSNVVVATDDGTRGFRGTIVECLRNHLAAHPVAGARIYGCGPTPMLKALVQFARESSIRCEVSLESAMACGFGICQGCPVELVEGAPRKYSLICKEGTVYDASTVVFP